MVDVSRGMSFETARLLHDRKDYNRHHALRLVSAAKPDAYKVTEQRADLSAHKYGAQTIQAV
jgi:hypothetical protein